MKTYLVFGAAGSIGSQVVNRLALREDEIFVSIKNKEQLQVLCERCNKSPVVGTHIRPLMIKDVADRKELENHILTFSNSLVFDAVIYAVGHCPDFGFDEEIRYPLSKHPLKRYMREIGMHQIGVLNVFQLLLSRVRNGGSFTFMSSAITRFQMLPPWLHAYHHSSVIAGEDWLIRGMRVDPAVTDRGIKINRIAPSAIDTPFHQSGPRPPKLLSVDEVVDTIIQAIDSSTLFDKIMTPQ